MHKILFYKFIKRLYMFRALCAHHQEVKKFYYTTSGIITTVGGRPVHRLREDCSPLPMTMSTIVLETCRGI